MHWDWINQTDVICRWMSCPPNAISHMEVKSTEGTDISGTLSLLELFSTLHASKRHQPNPATTRLFLHSRKD